MHRIPLLGERSPRVAAQAPAIASQMQVKLDQFNQEAAAATTFEEKAALATATVAELTGSLGALVAENTAQARENERLRRSKINRGRVAIGATALSGVLLANTFLGVFGAAKANEANADSATTPGNTPAQTVTSLLGPTPSLSQELFPTQTKSGAPEATTSGNPAKSVTVKVTKSGLPTKSGTPEATVNVSATVSGTPGTVGGAPTIGGAPSSEAVSPAAKALKERKAMLARADSKSTVAGAVATLRSTPATIKANLRSIFNKQSAKTLDHSKGSMSSLRSQYGRGELGALNSAEAVAYSVKGSPAYAAKVYNVMHGISGNQLPEGVSEQEALKSIEATMLEATDHFAKSSPEITVMNHGQRGETVFAAGVMHLNGDTEVFTMTTDDGTKIRFKIENRCLNIVTQEEETTVVTSTPVVVNQNEVVVQKKVVQKKVIKIIKEIEKRKHHKKHPGKKPRRPVPTPPHTREKVMPGPTVPGKKGGSGGEEQATRPDAGPAPAGVGQPQQQAPARETPQHGETTPTGPADTGTDLHPTQPATQGTPGTQDPAGQINGNTTPGGE